jgi:hypothetical protein
VLRFKVPSLEVGCASTVEREERDIYVKLAVEGSGVVKQLREAGRQAAAAAYLTRAADDVAQVSVLLYVDRWLLTTVIAAAAAVVQCSF